ncbi:hypothetical protein Bca101_064680 [Brassica carinata]
MNSGWRGIVVSCLLTVLVLTTAFFIGVDSAKVIPSAPHSASSSSSDPSTDRFIKNCWDSGKKEVQTCGHTAIERF